MPYKQAALKALATHSFEFELGLGMLDECDTSGHK